MVRPPEVPDPSRRRLLARFVNAVAATFGGALAALLGVFASRPAISSEQERWVRAGGTDDLVPGVPSARVLSIPTSDGWYRGRSRTAIFLTWDGTRRVRAFSATCTHLGCQVHWDLEAQTFRCPCHGGAYDRSGAVLEGPPPRPLDEIPARLDSDSQTVLVRV